jgi:hypothetical protein
MDYLCPFVAVFLIVSLVGHGFWLFVRAAIRVLTSDESRQAPGNWCSRCHVKLKSHEVRCPSCRKVLPELRKQYVEDLRATRRQLQRFRDDEVLEPEEADRLIKLLLASVDPEKLSTREHKPTVVSTSKSPLRTTLPETEQLAPRPELLASEDAFEEESAASSAKKVSSEPGPTMKQLLARDGQKSAKTAPDSKSSPSTDETGAPSPPSPARPAVPKPAPESSREPGRSFGELLGAFMEDRNIRWGELISSVLIVGCSIGLVISLWSTLESIPYFPALLFLLVTVAIHGAGLYTLRRWRLKTTSRGLLTIAQLLIPLNFLAAIALSHRGGTMRDLADPLVLGAIALGSVVFGAVSVSGSRVLSRPFQWWPLALAALLPSLGQVVINRAVGPGTSPGLLMLLAAIPICGFVVACAGQLAETRAWSRLTRRRTIQLLRVAGIGTFASLIPLGLLCWKSGNIRDTLSWLSPFISVAAASTLAIGLKIHRDALAGHLSQLRTAGTALSIFSGLLMASCLAIAWPHPGLLIAIGLTNFGILIALARISGFMGLLVPAIESLALAGLIGMHLASGTLTTGGEGFVFPTAAGGSYTPSLLSILLLGRSGILLQLGTVLALGAAFALKKNGHKEAAQSSATAAAGLLIGSLLACGNAALNFGTQTTLDVDLATLGLLIDGIAVLAAAVFIRRAELTYLGSALILATISHSLFANTAVEKLLNGLSLTPDHPLVFALLGHGLVMSLFALATRHWLSKSKNEEAGIRESILFPAVVTALVATTLTLPWTLFAADGGFLTRTAYSAIVTLTWLIGCGVLPMRRLLTGTQLTGIATVSLLMLGLSQHRDWWDGRVSDPRSVLFVAFGLTLWSGLWTTLRIRFRQSKLGDLFQANGTATVDRVLAASTILLTCGVAWIACGQSLSVSAEGAGSVPYSAPIFSMALLGLLATAIQMSLSARSQQPGPPGQTTGPVGGAVGAWPLASMATLIALPAFFVWASSNSNPWHEITGYGMSLEFWLAVPTAIAAAVLHLHDRPGRSTVTGAFVCLATIPAALAAVVPGTWSPMILGTGLAGLCGAVSIAAWRVSRVPTGSLASVARRLIPENFGPHIEQRAVAFLAVPTAAVSLIVAGRAVLSSGRFDPAHEPALSFAAYLAILLPLLILVGVAVFAAFRNRRSEFLLSGSLVWSAAALILYVVFALDRRLVSSEVVLIVQAIQSVGVAAVLFGLGWQLADWRWPMLSDAAPVEDDQSATAPVVEADSATVTTDLALRPSSRLKSHAAYVTPLEWQHRLVRVLALAPAAWATLLIFGQPTYEFASVAGQSQAAGILTVLLSAVLVLKSRPRPTGQEVTSALTLSTLALFAYAAISQYGAGPGSQSWRVFHLLSGGWLTTAAVAACVVWFSPRWFSNETAASLTEATRNALDDSDLPNQRAATDRVLPPLESMLRPLVTACFVVGGGVLAFATRSLFSDPFSPAWTSFLGLGAAAVFATPALRARNQRWAYRSAFVSVAAMTVLWLQPWLPFGQSGGSIQLSQSLVELTAAFVTACSLTAGFWLAVTLFWQKRANAVFDLSASGPSVSSSLTGIAMLFAFAAAVFAEFVPTATLQSTSQNAGYFLPAFSGAASHMGHVMLVPLAGLLIATLWDRKGRHVIACIFLLPTIATLVSLDAFPVSRQPLVASLAAAIHLAVSAGLLASRGSWFPRLEQSGVWNNDRGAVQTRRWLPIAGLVLTALVTVLALRSSLLDILPIDRLGPPICLLTLAMSLGFLADACRSNSGETTGDSWFGKLRVVSLTWTSLAAVLIVWGCSQPGFAGTVWLTRFIRLLEVLSVATFVFALPGVRLTASVDRWRSSLRVASSIHGVLALASLAIVLILEGVFFEPGVGTPVTGLQIAVVAGVLVGLAAGLIAMAVNPEHDPLDLSENQRQLYVYAAEALGGLLFLHIYLTMPELFSGRIRPYWPLIVMAIAFAGAGIGEVLRRSGHKVLADPLQRTGTLLPLLPALGFWMVTPRSELAAAYSTELFAAGLVYVFLSMWRKSYVHIVLAAVLGNAGLWAIWHELDLELLTTPQLWMIPPALSALVAAHLNRDRLTAAQTSSIRYASVTLIYVSSTGEMFLAGIGENLWLPIILATLSLIGIFAGILLRVRAFLYLGSSFLLLSVVSMVWHAARSLDQVWPWWVFGIATGIGMLALFGVFEKRRNDMLKLVGELRSWER